jgi:L-aminopeptidase/D-esterase-like protein
MTTSQSRWKVQGWLVWENMAFKTCGPVHDISSGVIWISDLDYMKQVDFEGRELNVPVPCLPVVQCAVLQTVDRQKCAPTGIAGSQFLVQAQAETRRLARISAGVGSSIQGSRKGSGSLPSRAASMGFRQ